MAKKGRKPKPVAAVFPDGTLNGWFNGIMDAMKLYGFDRTSILNSIRTGRPYKGCRWVYKQDYDAALLTGTTQKFAFTPRIDRDMLGHSVKGYHWQHSRNIQTINEFMSGRRS